MNADFRDMAPKPLNFEEMAAAWNNPVEFAKQKAIYNAQLVDGGHPPLWPDLDDVDEPTSERPAERFDDRMDLQ